MTFWSYGYALGEADESDLEERPRRVSLGRDETLKEKNRSLSVSVLLIIDRIDPKHHVSCPNSDS